MTKFHGWHAISAPHAADAVIVKVLQHTFVGYLYRPCLATIEQNRAHYCLVGHTLMYATLKEDLEPRIFGCAR